MDSAGIFHIPFHPFGRFQDAAARRNGVFPLFWACSGLELRFTGSELHIVLEVAFAHSEPWVVVELDGAPLIRVPLNPGVNNLCLLRGMEPGRVKRVRLFRESQPMPADPRQRLLVQELRWEGGSFLPPEEKPLRLEFVGDSLTSGEGAAGAREDLDWVPALFSGYGAWPRLTADALGADFRVVSQSGWGVRSGWDNDPRHALPAWYEAVCGPSLGDACRSLGAQSYNDFSAWRPDAVLVNLGSNDANAMTQPPWLGPDGETFRQDGGTEGMERFSYAVLLFLRKLRRCNPDARLVWAYGMAGDALRPQVEGAVERFREETGDENTWYLPLPEATEASMGSRNHPGAACHRAAAETAAAFLRSIL